MKLCSPEGHPRSTTLQAAARPQSLNNLRIGLLDNTKSPVDRMMEHLERRLGERLPEVEVFSISKMASGRPAGPDVMGKLVENCDVLINALAD